jgi:hypothetical protein
VVPIEAGLVAASVTMALASVLRAAVRNRWTRLTFLVCAALLGGLLVPSGAYGVSALAGGSGSNDWYGYVAQHPTDCEYINQQISQGGSNLGNPWISTYASVDGGSGCSNHSFTAAPGALSTRQDLYYWTGSEYDLCNNGPRIANGPVAYGAGGYYTHSLSTSYGFKVGGYPPCMNDTWFVPLSYNYFNTYPGGPWDGGTVMNAQLYVYVSSVI